MISCPGYAISPYQNQLSPLIVSPTDTMERLRMHVIDRIPDDQPLATLSINRGVPLVISHRRSAVGRAVRKLAKQLARDLEPEEVAEVRNGGMSRGFSSSRTATA